ncbi:MAG: hypothetical protein K0Q76_296 [Panacagrimonas sp.]|jgi:hypothetical protein|nr:hypothetical protein [Panacagrimonas sp.]MCC2655188.1 hypothetical protein [Panacagrimonas sp.]
MTRAACVLMVTMLLCACGGEHAGPAYFPLEPGLRWEYAVHEKNPVVDRTYVLEMRNLEARERDGERYARRLGSDGNEYWILVGDKALARAGVRTAIDMEPRMDEKPRIVMQLPPAAEQWWEVESRPYILERVEPFRERFSQDESKRVPLHMKVAALDETVEVPAGRFEKCLRLEGTGLLNVLADARIGASEVPVTHTEWYAPGVGLVKLIRKEVLDTQAIVGGTITMELTDFTP